MQFTKSALTALALPEGKSDHVVWDDDLPGFGLRLRGDTRRWVVQYRIGGQSRRESIGDPRRVSLEDARRTARQRFGIVAQGLDPAADKTRAKAEAEAARVTLAVVTERYLEGRKPVVRPSTLSAVKHDLRSHWAPLHKRPIAAIKRADIAARLGEIAKDNGRVAAARARASLSAMFGWAMREGLCEANPVIATNNPNEGAQSRERVLADDELRALWRGCGDDDFGRIVRLLMLTGCRRDEIGGMRWEEIDPDTSVLTVPGTRTKNHSELKLTLPAAALAILPPRPADGRGYVFGHKQGFRAWSYATALLNGRIARMEGKLPTPWRLHDLRRTMRTGLGRLGVAPHVAELVLNHTKRGMIAVYDKYRYQSEIATALDLWSAYLMSVVDGRATNVVPLRCVGAS
jgi:integrase